MGGTDSVLIAMTTSITRRTFIKIGSLAALATYVPGPSWSKAHRMLYYNGTTLLYAAPFVDGVSSIPVGHASFVVDRVVVVTGAGEYAFEIAPSVFVGMPDTLNVSVPELG